MSDLSAENRALRHTFETHLSYAALPDKMAVAVGGTGSGWIMDWEEYVEAWGMWIAVWESASWLRPSYTDEAQMSFSELIREVKAFRSERRRPWNDMDELLASERHGVISSKAYAVLLHCNPELLDWQRD